MNQPIECGFLTIYPTRPGQVRHGGSWTPEAIILGTSTKRLTDAELMAETWRAEFDYERAFHGMCYLSGNWDPGKFATYDRRNTIERFAAHPHAHPDT